MERALHSHAGGRQLSVLFRVCTLLLLRSIRINIFDSHMNAHAHDTAQQNVAMRNFFSVEVFILFFRSAEIFILFFPFHRIVFYSAA